MKDPIIQYDPAIYLFPRNSESIAFGLEKYLDKSYILGRESFFSKQEKIFETSYFKYFDELFYDESYQSIISNYINKHGIFAWVYFSDYLGPVILKKFTTIKLDLNEFRNLYKETYPQRVPVDAEIKSCIYTIKSEIYFKTITIASKNRTNIKLLQDWFEDNKNIIKCELCSREYRMVDLPYWIYYGSNGLRGCCYHCPIIDFPTKGDLYKFIPDFINTCGFIPNANANLRNKNFTSRINIENWQNIFLAYGRIWGIEYVKKQFGSWFKALAITGCLPNDVKVTGRGIKCISKDGHECNSLDEQRIDNWLTDNKIKHEKEPLYPIHSKFNSSGKRRADWKVGEVFIEYFGLTGETKYDEKTLDKIMLVRETGINLIEIYPHQLNNLSEVLGHLS